ncbi:hypothetical protein AAZX31_14G144000 [Glycine max]
MSFLLFFFFLPRSTSSFFVGAPFVLPCRYSILSLLDLRNCPPPLCGFCRQGT